MKNEFTFHSVGHGLFYSGSLYDGEYNFVYDCGGEKNKINTRLENYKAKNENVDFLVISHLDKDHVCGVYYLNLELQKQGKEIKKVYFPYLYDSKKIFLPKSHSDDGFIFKLVIANALSTTSGEYKGEVSEIFKFWVKLLDEEKITFVEKNLYNNNGNLENQSEEIPFNEKFPFSKNGQVYWWFEMFGRIKNKKKNKKAPVDIRGIKSEINDKEIEGCLSNENGYEKIKKIYEKYCSSINASSTVLIHYPENKGCFNENYVDFESKYVLEDGLLQLTKGNSFDKTAMTILTGDAEFDGDMLSKMKAIMSERADYMKIFLVPHHGSRKNWDCIGQDKLKFNIYVISFKYGSRCLNHKVLFELIAARKYIRPVTQDIEYSYDIN